VAYFVVFAVEPEAFVLGLVSEQAFALVGFAEVSDYCSVACPVELEVSAALAAPFVLACFDFDSY